MNKYLYIFLCMIYLTACDSSEDIAQFEKEQAELTTRLKAEEDKKDPCMWTGLGKGCDVISFGDEKKLYILSAPQGDILTTSAADIRYTTHHLLSNYKQTIVDFLLSRGFATSLKSIEFAEKNMIFTQEEGYILMVDMETAQIHITEKGIVRARPYDDKFKSLF